MRESVYEIGIGLSGIEFDKASNAILITVFAESGHPIIRALAKLFGICAKVANSTSKSDGGAGFRLNARDFFAYATPNSIQIHYDFGDVPSDLLGSRVDLVRDLIDSQIIGVDLVTVEMSKDQPVKKAYEAAGFADFNDAYEMTKIFADIATHAGTDEISVKISGSDVIREINIPVTPDKPEFEPDDREVVFARHEILVVSKKNRQIKIAPESGKGLKTIELTSEQYTALFNHNAFSLNEYELFDFTVKQTKPTLYILIDVKCAGTQTELDI
ncbi:hypothetical protein FJM67_08215 [Maribrevibacterium harenarium]|uniref:Uncharacterized protein n=1 Tax=Maribrevibacterium harenarium TaxID=2589817 RepID=A0A501WSX9_9GAMM|nr:hypothetical protein [Maribrevibacterium harenarium]TPE51952.1 hypothetical protein FJM67_08215 [Maribrevibacterium harenarium]